MGSTATLTAAFFVNEKSQNFHECLRRRGRLQRYRCNLQLVAKAQELVQAAVVTTRQQQQETTVRMMSTGNHDGHEIKQSSSMKDDNQSLINTPAEASTSKNNNSSTNSKTVPGYTKLYPPFPSFVCNGTIQLDEIHTLYYEEYSTITKNQTMTSPPNSETVALFLHGGPGASSNPNHARFFNPKKYTRIILYDQRGCGKSTPKGEIRQNTLGHLVTDIEILRQHLNISHWDVILGGSWGVTLALSYTQCFPNNVGSLVLRGIFCLRPEEIYWLFGKDMNIGGGEGGTASFLFPMQWKPFEDAVSPKVDSVVDLKEKEQSAIKSWDGKNKEEEKNKDHGWDVLHAYYDRLLGDDPIVRLNAAKSWFTWEMGVYSNSSSLSPSSSLQASRDQRNDSALNSTANITDTSTTIASYPLLSYKKDHGWSIEGGGEINKAGNKSEMYTTDKINSIINSLRKWSKTSFLDRQSQSPQQIASQNSAPLKIRQIRPIISNATQKTSNETGVAEKKWQEFIPAQAMLTCFYSVNALYMIENFSLFTSPPAEKKELQTMFRSIPCIAIQGGNDLICPPDTVFDLHQIWPEMEVRIPLHSGHSMYDDAITSEIIKATDWFADGTNRKRV